MSNHGITMAWINAWLPIGVQANSTVSRNQTNLLHSTNQNKSSYPRTQETHPKCLKMNGKVGKKMSTKSNGSATKRENEMNFYSDK